MNSYPLSLAKVYLPKHNFTFLPPGISGLSSQGREAITVGPLRSQSLDFEDGSIPESQLAPVPG
jgi:hypothetical protein